MFRLFPFVGAEHTKEIQYETLMTTQLLLPREFYETSMTKTKSSHRQFINHFVKPRMKLRQRRRNRICIVSPSHFPLCRCSSILLIVHHNSHFSSLHRHLTPYNEWSETLVPTQISMFLGVRSSWNINEHKNAKSSRNRQFIEILSFRETKTETHPETPTETQRIRRNQKWMITPPFLFCISSTPLCFSIHFPLRHVPAFHFRFIICFSLILYRCDWHILPIQQRRLVDWEEWILLHLHFTAFLLTISFLHLCCSHFSIIESCFDDSLPPTPFLHQSTKYSILKLK